MIHKTIKNLIRNILLQTERKESISKWYAFLITLSSKTIPSIFKMNNLPCYYNTAIFRMGITNHLVAVPSEKHLYPFSAVIVSPDQFFIQKVLSYYVSRLNVFIWSRSELHSWKLFAKQFLCPLTQEGLNASKLGSKIPRQGKQIPLFLAQVLL